MAVNNSAIAQAVRLGLRLQEESSNKIASLYKKHNQAGIVQLLDIMVKYNIHNREIARTGIGFCLFGNSNENIGPVYDGLFEQEERQSLAKKHISETLLLNRLNGKLGYIPWTHGETLCAHLLKKSKAYTNNQISSFLNEHHHSGESVRNSNMVKIHVSRFRKYKLSENI